MDLVKFDTSHVMRSLPLAHARLENLDIGQLVVG